MTEDRQGADSDVSGRWLPIEPAAQALGVTERTVRRRMAAGTVRTHRNHRRVLVWVTDDASGTVSVRDSDDVTDASVTVRPRPDADTDTDRVADAVGHAVTEMGRLLEAERQRADTALQELIRAREAAAMWQERARGLEAETQRLQAQLALPAPQLAPHAPWWAFWRQGREIAH